MPRTAEPRKEPSPPAPDEGDIRRGGWILVLIGVVLLLAAVVLVVLLL